MKMPTAKQMALFLLFAFPAYAPTALWIIALAVWKVRFSHPDMLLLMLVIAAILAAAVLLLKKQWSIAFPMIVMGGYITFALDNEQHFGGAFKLYGVCIMLHYLICLIYMLKKENR